MNEDDTEMEQDEDDTKLCHGVDHECPYCQFGCNYCLMTGW
jgi:uncharacterized protein YutD